MPSLNVDRTTPSQKKKILKYASEIRKFEIERFWQRSIFFWGFIGAAFVAYATLFEDQKQIALLIAFFGLVCSVAWTLQNRGSKYWQEAWEQKVETVESILGVPLFSNWEPVKKKGIWGAQKFSVSKLTIALSDFTVLIWIGLVIEAYPEIQLPGSTVEHAFALLIITVTYLILIFSFASTDDDAPNDGAVNRDQHQKANRRRAG
jgi:hypothetical protein